MNASERRAQQHDPLTEAQINIGRLEERVDHLTDSVDELKSMVKTLNASLIGVQATLSEARGGWRTLMYIGGMGATLGAGIAWIITHLAGKGLP
jgi:hypothetical protein